ncbi:hypothetical protein K5962_13285 [Klebsiella pneumoniae]|uniref:hypothetical protein n=1 Tax=Klebsiella pneumoniae TaxID=573 RepID=UPI001C8C1B3F|nr:hypothetical protein [Klebsiella pneumoniae]MBX9262126.1 hypothetical protein [Klebsiella pneumoniae]
MSALIDLGVRQFKFMSLECCDANFITSLSQYRATESFRSKTAKKEDLLLIISQDCDIDSRSFDYIEVLVFRKAKARDSRSAASIEYARNVHKIFLKDFDEEYVLKKEEVSLLKKEIFLQELDRLNQNNELNLREFNVENTKSILLSWLVNYYARRPLPDGFNRSLFDKYIKNPEGHPLQNFLIKYYNEILDVYAFVHPMDEEDALVYDVTLTALLSQECTKEQGDIISNELELIIGKINEQDERLNMMQASGTYLHEAALIDYVLMPSEFSMENQIQTRKLTLDFLCWMPKEEEEP